MSKRINKITTNNKRNNKRTNAITNEQKQYMNDMYTNKTIYEQRMKQQRNKENNK